MTSLTLYERGRDLEPVGRMFRELDRELGWMLGGWMPEWDLPVGERFETSAREWDFGPRVDLSETEEKYTVRAEVPGYKRDELHVDVSADAVSLKGEHREEGETKTERYLCRETCTGAFERIIRLPNEVRTDGVDATLKDGVLTLTLPKVASAVRREVEVHQA